MTGPGVLLMGQAAIDTDRAGWLARRQDGITGTDVAGLLGLSSWTNPHKLYHDKLLGEETGDKPALARGRHLEPVIDDMLTGDPAQPEWEVTRHWAIRRAGLYASATTPWMLATLDRWILDTEGTPLHAMDAFAQGTEPAHLGQHVAVGEYKTWSHRDPEVWGDPPYGRMPRTVRAQAIWNMAVAGARRTIVVVLWMREWRLGVYYLDAGGAYVQRDLELMRAEAEKFLHRIRIGDEPPPDDSAASASVVRRLWPDTTEGAEVILPRSLAARYHRARTAKAKAEDRLRGVQTLMRARGKDAHRYLARDAAGELATVCTRSVGDTPVRAFTRHDDRMMPGKWRP